MLLLINKLKSRDVVVVMRNTKLYDYNLQVLAIKFWNQDNYESCKFLYVSLYSAVE